MRTHTHTHGQKTSSITASDFNFGTEMSQQKHPYKVCMDLCVRVLKSYKRVECSKKL
jgi:hypothetical protein